MLTPIKKQGDEHIYILLQISIINWVSVRYVDILRFVWMLIGSEIVSLNYAASGKRLSWGQGENPVFRITKKYVPLNR